MRTNALPVACAVLLATLLWSPASTGAQEIPPVAPDTVEVTSHDTYRLRVENRQFGRVEVSVDCGEHFLLVGRVVKPATLAEPSKQALESGRIVRSSGDGIAFAVAAGQIVKILPGSDLNIRTRTARSAVVTDIKPRAGIFGEFCPPPGTSALLGSEKREWKSYPDGFAPTEEAVFGFVVILPSTQEAEDGAKSPPDPERLARLAEVRKRLTAVSEQYTGQAMTRARDNKRPVVSGVVMLRPKLPENEPEPITAITYSIDGDTVSAQTILPSTYGWDTSRVKNGEHVVEIRALSKYATVVTRVRALVMVNNP